MAVEMIANTDIVVAHDDSSLISDGAFTITSLPSDKVFAGSRAKGVHVGEVEYTFKGGSAEGFIDGSVATAVTQNVPASSTVTAGRAAGVSGAKENVVRDGDTALMNCVGTIDPTPAPPAPPQGPVIGNVIINVIVPHKVKSR